MQLKWLIAIVMLYIFGTFFGGIMEQSFYGDASSMQNLAQMGTWHILGVTIPYPSMAWVESMGNILFWDFKFFQNTDGSANEWSLFRFLFLVPVSIGMVIMFSITFIPMLLDGAKTLRAMLPF